MPELGDVIGAYRLEAQLGAGGMGAVFRAKHVLLGREVALKVLDDKLAADEQYVSRFFQEAKIVNEVRHPNIIDVVDYIATREPRVVAYVMELLDGCSLGDLLASGPVSPLQAIHASLQITSALSAVHRVNVIHRDLKPDNIFVLRPHDRDWSAVPSVKVLDFGIAKFDERQVGHRTQSGIMIGTPAYMAPEQVWGEKVTAAADVFAVGEIIFEMFAGQRMFAGPTTEMMKRKAAGVYETEVVLPASTPSRDVLTDLVRRCVALQAQARPTLEEVVRTLESVAKAPSVRAAAFSESLPVRAHSVREPQQGLITRPERREVAETPAPPSLQSHARRRPSKPLIFAGLFAGVFLAGAGIYLQANEVEPAAAVEEPPAVVQPPPPARSAVFTKVPIESDPAGAEVYDLERNERLGVTPLEVPLADPLATRTLELRREGFEKRRVTIDGTSVKTNVALVAVEPVATKPPEKARPRRAKIEVPEPAPVEVARPEPAPPAQPPPVRDAKPLRKNESTEW